MIGARGSKDDVSATARDGGQREYSEENKESRDSRCIIVKPAGSAQVVIILYLYCVYTDDDDN